MTKEFAKIVKATDGAQVLFYLGTSEDGEPTLYQYTEMEGFFGSLDLHFRKGDTGWKLAEEALTKADVVMADAVREQFVKLLQE